LNGIQQRLIFFVGSQLLFLRSTFIEAAKLILSAKRRFGRHGANLSVGLILYYMIKNCGCRRSVVGGCFVCWRAGDMHPVAMIHEEMYIASTGQLFILTLIGEYSARTYRVYRGIDFNYYGYTYTKTIRYQMVF